MRVHKVVIAQDELGQLLPDLIQASVWFEVEPQPDGFVALAVKIEHEQMLQDTLTTLGVSTIGQYVVLALLVRVALDLHGEPVGDIAHRLKQIMVEAYGDGLITGETNAELLSHAVDVFRGDAPIFDVTLEPVCEHCEGPVYVHLTGMKCPGCDQPVKLALQTVKL